MEFSPHFSTFALRNQVLKLFVEYQSTIMSEK